MMMRTTRALDHEWETDYAQSCAGRRAIRSWSLTEPALRGLGDLAEVLEARRIRERSGQILSALARLAPSERLAARTLLQALLPGLVDLALRQFHDDPDAFEELTALAWERICTYPPNRRGGVAGNVLLDVRKRYLAARSPNGWAEVPVAEVLPDQKATAPSAEHEVLVAMALEQFFASVDSGLITERAFDMIVRTRIGDESIEELAADHAVTNDNVLCVRWRAEQRLRRELDPAA